MKVEFILVVVFLIAIQNCVGDSTSKQNREADVIESLNSVEISGKPYLSINFTEEITFGQSNDNLIGRMGSFAVDNYGRVIIGDSQKQNISVFDEHGNHLMILGREGRGPGEFQFMGKISVLDNNVIAFDPIQYRYHKYSIDELSLIETVPMTVQNQHEFEELKDKTLEIMYPISQNKFLGIFSSPMVYSDPSDPRYNLDSLKKIYFVLSKDGSVATKKVFETHGIRSLKAKVKGELRFTQFEFLGKTLVAISNDEKIFIARSEQFAIDIYDSAGTYMNTLFYPYQRIKFTKEKAIELQEQIYEGEEYVIDWRSSVINGSPVEDLPQYWPALNDMFIDDENRIWVSTIVEDFNIYEWWVLEESGKLISKFEWPRNEPIEVIKQGKMYTRQTDEETGLQQIVRYRVELEPLR